MNVHIEKISNGFILTIGIKRVFCDVPEAVCGELAQWALAECENTISTSEAALKVAVDTAHSQLASAAKQQQAWIAVGCSPKPRS